MTSTFHSYRRESGCSTRAGLHKPAVLTPLQTEFRPMADDPTEREQKPAQASEIVRLMREAQEMPRSYASFYDWPHKGTKEWALAKQFVDTRADLTVIDIKMGGDPPDCELVLSSGHVIGLEIVELVDQQMIEHVVRTGETDAYADWSFERLQAELMRIVIGKGEKLKKARGGPFSNLFLLIHTDETMLCHGNLPEWIAKIQVTTSLIDEAYLLESYSPHERGCYPLHRLNIVKK